MKKLLRHPLILFLLLALGILAAVLLVKTRPGVEHTDKAMEPRHADVLTVQKQPFAARVTAYGNVEPAVVLQSRAQVAGKVSYVHPDLKAGGSIPAGTVVVRIDPQDYEVSLEQTQADLRASQSSLAQLEAEETSTRRSLSLAEENLRVGEKELERVREIWEKRLISRSAVDAEEQKVLQLRQQVQDLQGRLDAFTSRKAATQAQIDRARQQVKGQTTTLGRTEISVPFDARISSADVEVGEFVAVGGSLFEALNTDGVEIKAEIPLDDMRTLVSALQGQPLRFDAANARNVLQQLELQARVRPVGVGNGKAVWEGRVARFSEAIDPTRRTLGIVVAVDNPYENVIVGERPPLLKGMYVAVDIYGPQRDALVIPRQAVHEDRVYVVGDEQTLEIRKVAIRFRQNGDVVLENGIQEGEQVVLNDLIPVIPGMPLAPREVLPAAAPAGDAPQAEAGAQPPTGEQ